MTSYQTRPRRNRRGQYALLTGLLFFPVLMLSALVVDGALLESAATEADASAYAAAHSALMVYRESGDRVLARHSAKEALKANAVHGNHPSLEELEWGYVIGSSGLFVPDADATEAVRVTAARRDNNAVRLLLGGLLGWSSSGVVGRGVSNDPEPTSVDDCGGEWADTTPLDPGIHWVGATSGPEVMPIEIEVAQSGWYELFKDGIAESGPAQRNESAYFRVSNSTFPEGYSSETNCGSEYVVQDYDNEGPSTELVYLGTFWLEAEETNLMHMRHYCAIREDCPSFENLTGGTSCTEHTNSVHFETGGGLCLEAL